MGRPSKATPALKDEIARRMIEGESLREICADKHVPDRVTIFRWLETDEDFAAKYARAREMQGDFMDELIYEVGRNTTPETATADRVKLLAFQWRAAKLRPKVYGDKLDLTSGGEKLGLAAEIEAARKRVMEGKNADN